MDLADSPLSEAQLEEARQYGRLRLWCDLADRALDLGVLCVLTLIAWPIDIWLHGYISAPIARLAIFFVLIGVIQWASAFPLSVYSGYALEHRFGLSRQNFARWFGRHLMRHGFALVFGLLLIVGLYEIIWHTGSLWWFIAAAVFFVVSVVVGQLVPVFIPLFYKVEPLADEEMLCRMNRLAAGTGLAIEGVYRLGLGRETAKANAMLTGLGRTRRVLLGDTLLDQFTPDEIEVVLAHEIGHHVHRHIPKIILAGMLYSAAGFWLCDGLLLTWARQHDPSVVHANLPPATLPLLMLLLTLFSLAMEPLQNAISRRYERQCDRYALERTGLYDAYASCFRKLSVLNKDDPAPHPLKVFLFHSHPPIAERLAAGAKP